MEGLDSLGPLDWVFVIAVMIFMGWIMSGFRMPWNFDKKDDDGKKG